MTIDLYFFPAISLEIFFKKKKRKIIKRTVLINEPKKAENIDWANIVIWARNRKMSILPTYSVRRSF